MLDLKTKKIVFLFTPGPIGGAEKIVLGGIKALIQSSLNVELWVIKEERVPQVADAFISLAIQEGIKPRIFSSHKIFDLKLLSGLKQAFNISLPDIIHAHGFKAAFYGKLACGSKNLVITHHGKTAHTLKVRIYEFLELIMMKRANAVVAVSHEMRQQLILSGVKQDKVSLVENFMTISSMEKSKVSRSLIKFLFVGRLSPEKGCESLIVAFKKLNDPQLELIILGDGVERTKLEELAKSANIKFLGFQKNVSEHMSQVDALIMPSFREGQPLTLIEACIMGLPVLASNVGGIPELVHQNQNGLLFEAGKDEQIIQCLNLFKAKKDSLTIEAEKMSLKYSVRFAPETWSKNTQTIYQTVLNQR